MQVNFEKAIAGYLQKQLVRDHYLRLDQSGVSGGIDARIPVGSSEESVGKLWLRQLAK